MVASYFGQALKLPLLVNGKQLTAFACDVCRADCHVYPPQSLTAITAWGVDSKGASQSFAVGMDRGEAAVLDTRARQLVRHWAAHSEGIADLACTGEQLITASEVRTCLTRKASLTTSRERLAPTW